MDEVLVKMRDVLEEQRLVTQADVVEQHEVLVDLAHVTDMRHHRNARFLAIRLTARNSLMPATRTASTWIKPERIRLQVVLEDHPVRHMLARRHLRVRRVAFARVAWPRMSSGCVGSSIQNRL